jgi:hypothetical protein
MEIGAKANTAVMNPRVRALVQVGLLLTVLIVLFLLFPSAFAFVQRATRELRYLWWLILLVALAVWLIWAGKRRPR